MNDVYAVVDNNVVINVIIWDGISEWKPEAGNLVPLTAMLASVGHIQTEYLPRHLPQNALTTR
ncbi:hypothetical protein ACNF02_08920 [Escherichia coli]